MGARDSEAVRVGVIGAGGIARGMHFPSLTEMPDVRIEAVCDLVEEKAGTLAEKYGVPKIYVSYREMLEKERDALDAVFVLVEPANLFHVTWHCLDAGLHTFMEKPPGVTACQAEALARKAESAGRILQVGFNRRHIPLVRRVVQLVREATTITQVEGCFFKYGAGAFDKGSLPAFTSDTIHAVDLIRSIAGADAEAAALIESSYDGEPVPNAWNGVIRFSNGVTGVVKANYRVGGRVHRFEVHGPGVSAFINLGMGGQECDAVVLTHQGGQQYSLSAAGVGSHGKYTFDGRELAGHDALYRFYGFYQEDRHFIDCVRDGRTPETSIQDAVKSIRLIEMLLANRF